MLESLGVNKKVDKAAPNDVQKETIQKMEPMHISSKEMSRQPLREQIEETKEKKQDSIKFQKEHSSMGIDTTSEKEEKKKKALEALFTKKVK